MPQDFDIHEWRLYQANLNLLNEEDEDDFNITIGDEWGIRELGVGDEITPDMWDFDKIEDWIVMRSKGDHAQVEYELRQIQNLKTDNIKINDIKKEQMGGWDDVWVELDHPLLDSFSDSRLNTFLKPQFRVIPFLNESDDDFNITTDAFDVTELTIGDIINSSDMFEKPESYKFYFNSEPHIIKRIFRSDGEDTVDVSPVGGKRGEGWEMSLEGLNSLLKNKYRIIKPLKSLRELEDDDFNITLDDEWGVKELGVGDTIIGDMWDWEKIINAVNNEHRDDHAGIIRDIERWKTIYDEGITINSIETNRDAQRIDFDSNFLNWGPGINWVNKLLSPGYKIYTPMNESEDDDFNITLGDEWGVKELSNGDFITFDMLNSKTMNIYKDYSYYFPFKLERKKYDGYHVISKNGIHTFYSPDSLNDMLKPQFRVISPLNESEDDDFNITLDDKWNEYDGDVEIIMRGPWRYDLVTYLENDDIGFIEDFEKLNPNIILDDYDTFIEYRTYKVKTNTEQLRNEFLRWDNIPEGNIFTDVSIDGLVGWLGGDVDDVKRFIYSEALYNNDFDKEVIDSKILLWENSTGKYWEIEWPPNYKPDDIIDEYLDEIDDDEIELISVKPLNLNESEEDDFNITLGDEWGYEELTVGDYVKPEMWKDGTDPILKSKPLKIYEFGIDDEGDYVTFRRHNDDLIDFDLDEINLDYLKPKYKIVLPLNEQDDDDFNITLGDEWNIKPITIGDYLDSNNSRNKDIILKLVNYDPSSKTIGVIKYTKNKDGKLETTQTRPFQTPVGRIKYFLKPGYELILPN